MLSSTSRTDGDVNAGRRGDGRDGDRNAAPSPAPSTFPRPLLALIGLLILAELLAAGANPGIGLWLHALLLVLLLFYGAIGQKRDVYVALMLAPLLRITSLTMPVGTGGTATQLALVYLPVFIAALISTRALGFSRRDLGVTWRGFFLQLLIGLSGVAFGVLEFVILRPDPIAASFAWQALLWPIVSLMVFTGFGEELIFRGVLQTALVRNLGPRVGIVLVAIVFTAMHIAWRNPLHLLVMFVASLWFSWAFHRSRSLVGVALAHGITNVTLFVLLPLLFPA